MGLKKHLFYPVEWRYGVALEVPEAPVWGASTGFGPAEVRDRPNWRDLRRDTRHFGFGRCRRGTRAV